MQKPVVNVMVKAARQAGNVILRHMSRLDGLKVIEKARQDYASEVDSAAEAEIIRELKRATPDYAFLAEESGQQGKSRYTWVIDPLDGTKEFIQRRGDFTVNIALVENGVPIRGLVYAPAKARLFYTRADGTSVEEVGPFGMTPQSLRPLRVSRPDTAALRVVASKSHRDAATDAYIARYQVADLKSAGSSLKFCLIAAGEADFYPRLGRTMEWDTAAGHAVVLGAGGQVVMMDDHSPLTYGKRGYENPFFLAFAPGVVLA